MTEPAFVWKDQKQLRMGYTTGSCAAAAAKAAARMLLSQEEVRQVSLMTPKGIRLYLDVEEILCTQERVRCAIRKDAGDDPDVTGQILVYAEVTKTSGDQIVLDGGIGVGRVTRKGLEQKIGDAAINKVPRAMIREAMEKERERFCYSGGLSGNHLHSGGRRAGKKDIQSKTWDSGWDFRAGNDRDCGAYE